MLQQFLTTPPEIQQLILIAVTVLVSFVILQIAAVPSLKWLADYLGANKTAIVTWAVALIVQFIDVQLTGIPAQWEPVALAVGQLIVAVAAALGLFNYLSYRGVRGLK